MAWNRVIRYCISKDWDTHFLWKILQDNLRYDLVIFPQGLLVKITQETIYRGETYHQTIEGVTPGYGESGEYMAIFLAHVIFHLSPEATLLCTP